MWRFKIPQIKKPTLIYMVDKPIKNIYFVRTGNKQTDIKYFEHLLPFKNINTIIEPFAGTFAVIRNCYYDKKYKRIINDNDKEWIKLLKYIKNKPSYINNLLAKLTTIKNKNDFLNYIKNNPLSDILKKTLLIRGMYKMKKNINNINELHKLLKKSSITNQDACKVLQKYKNNKNAFIFCDPPYLDSNNIDYNQ